MYSFITQIINICFFPLEYCFIRLFFKSLIIYDF